MLVEDLPASEKKKFIIYINSNKSGNISSSFYVGFSKPEFSRVMRRGPGSPVSPIDNITGEELWAYRSQSFYNGQ